MILPLSTVINSGQTEKSIMHYRQEFLKKSQWMVDEGSWWKCVKVSGVTSARVWTLIIIIHQTHYEKPDWSRAFNRCTIACELDMINAISAADIIFIMSSSKSAWLPSPLKCSPQKQNGWTLRLYWGWGCIIKQLLNSAFTWYHELSKPRVCIICLSLRLRQITQTSVLIIHDIMLNLIQ